MKIGIKMSLLKRVNDIDLYVVPNQQWVVCAMYPYYKSLEKFFDFTNEDYKDISKGSCTVNGIQKPLADEEWDKERTEYKEWLLDTFRQVQVPIKQINEDWEGGEQYKAWTINYFPGGWQAGHFHSTQRFDQQNKRFASSVMFFDTIQPTKKNPFNGCLYTILQDVNGYTYDHKFHPEPGKVVVFDDRVWHGAYPTQDMRRSLVWNFDIET